MMRALWAFVAVISGALGSLAVLRSLEELVIRGPGSVSPVSVVFGLAFLYGAWRAALRTRRPSATPSVTPPSPPAEQRAPGT
jgi:hypothetical protein